MTDAVAAEIAERRLRCAPSPLREPWEELPKQREAATFGMWLFLMSEMLFFGGLFLAFAFSRALNIQAFAGAARETNLVYGSSNTFVLVTSSLTITLASRAADLGRSRLAAHLLTVTAILGVVFLVVKGFEYHDDIERHLLPGADFRPHEAAAQLFFGFYWVMTGVHAIHLAAGIGLVCRLSWLLAHERISPATPQIEAASLFWHLVDAFWIVLFPLLYVASRT
jgi:cytochrome c oxidase subunit 3